MFKKNGPPQKSIPVVSGAEPKSALEMLAATFRSQIHRHPAILEANGDGSFPPPVARGFIVHG